MVYKAVISDWNGTVTESSEVDSNKRIGYTMLGDAKKAAKGGSLRALGTLGRLAMAKIIIERRLAAYEGGEGHLWDVYRPFNFAIRGQSPHYINSIVDGFAADTISQIDGRFVRPIAKMHGKGKITGILSVAYERVIRSTLVEAGYSRFFDHIVANSLEVNDGSVVGFTMDIYGRKAEVLRREFFERLGLTEKDVLYAGDTEDDEPIADLLPRGHFIVPLLASAGFRERMASKGAFAPEDEKDFELYLRKR